MRERHVAQDPLMMKRLQTCRHSTTIKCVITSSIRHHLPRVVVICLLRWRLLAQCCHSILHIGVLGSFKPVAIPGYKKLGKHANLQRPRLL